jgi:predicted nucleic acid-binding protein
VILVDTSVWIDYFNGIKNQQSDYLEYLLSTDTVIVGDIILAELLQGFDSDREFKLAKQALDPLDCVTLGGKSIAIQAATNFRILRSKGITIRKTVDMLIGTWCINHQVTLLHRDKDFDQMAMELPLIIYDSQS